MTPPYEIRESEDGIGSILIPMSPWNSEVEARLAFGDVGGIRLSYSAGFRGADISFLSQFSKLLGVEIYSQDIRDMAPLKGLSDLNVLGLQTAGTFAFQSRWFPRLRVLKCQWRKGMDDLLRISTLEYVNVINWPFADLAAIAGLEHLRRLSITSRKLASLDGVEALGKLESIDLYNCPNLLSVTPLERCESLKKVEIEACRHVPTRLGR